MEKKRQKMKIWKKVTIAIAAVLIIACAGGYAVYQTYVMPKYIKPAEEKIATALQDTNTIKKMAQTIEKLGEEGKIPEDRVDRYIGILEKSGGVENLKQTVQETVENTDSDTLTRLKEMASAAEEQYSGESSTSQEGTAEQTQEIKTNNTAQNESTQASNRQNENNVQAENNNAVPQEQNGSSDASYEDWYEEYTETAKQNSEQQNQNETGQETEDHNISFENSTAADNTSENNTTADSTKHSKNISSETNSQESTSYEKTSGSSLDVLIAKEYAKNPKLPGYLDKMGGFDKVYHLATTDQNAVIELAGERLTNEEAVEALDAVMNVLEQMN